MKQSDRVSYFQKTILPAHRRGPVGIAPQLGEFLLWNFLN